MTKASAPHETAACAGAPMGAMNMLSIAFVTVGHPGVMVGAPDASMSFRTGTRFLPYWALRNISGRAIVMNLLLYTNDGVALTVPAQSSQPWESRQLNMAATLQQLGLQDFNGTVTLAASHTGQASDVISAAGSADLLGTYVFPVAGRGSAIGLSKHSPSWTVKNGSNVMISLWNPSATAEDVVVTLSYALGSGVYNFKVHLAPNATANLDVRDIINDQSPDADGNVIPQGVQEGSLSFHSAPGLKMPVSLNVNVGSFNVISQSAADVAVEVVYTVQGVSSPLATTTLTVSKPQTLIIKTDITNNTGHSCVQGVGTFTQSLSYYSDILIGARYTSYVRTRTYSIQDYLGNTISLSMNLFESYSPLESQISVGTGVGDAATDFFAYCPQTCRTGGAQTLTSNQSIYANNFPIAYKAVSWTCAAVTVVL